MNISDDLLKKYPWLSISPIKFEEYLPSSYYDRILKEYIFEGKTDLLFLKKVLERNPTISQVLELGPGPGRATQTLLDSAHQIKELTLVDLSEQMLQRCKERFTSNDFISYVHLDSLDFLESTDKSFDFVFSLWSFSHSIHQTLFKLGEDKGTERVSEVLSKFITKNISPGGKIFIMQFDSLSDEQKISIRQRGRKYPFYKDQVTQSPSKIILDSVFEKLKVEEVIEFTSTHHIGKPIEFKSLDEALEYYMNFHMESLFNTSEDVQEIISELTEDIGKHRDTEGVIRIKPGCFVYEITRN